MADKNAESAAGRSARLKQRQQEIAAECVDRPLVVRRAEAEQIQAILDVEYAEAHCELDFTSSFELLVATVLSAQTTDRRVNTVTPSLFQRWPTAADLAAAPVEEVESVVRPLGMYHRRAQSLISLSAQLEDSFDGRVPGDRDGLTSLHGVGRKTANVVLGNWFGAQEITVDTHVARVTRRLGWADAANPLAIEEQLRELLPDAPWTQLCHELIFHGRRVCTARRPACADCPVLELCPSAVLYV